MASVFNFPTIHGYRKIAFYRAQYIHGVLNFPSYIYVYVCVCADAGPNYAIKNLNIAGGELAARLITPIKYCFDFGCARSRKRTFFFALKIQRFAISK